MQVENCEARAYGAEIEELTKRICADEALLKKIGDVCNDVDKDSERVLDAIALLLEGYQS